MTGKTETAFELKDGASGRSSQLPVRTGTIGPAALDIAGLHKDLDVFTYDPGFGATAAEESSFMEVAYLLLLGELPTSRQLEEFTGNIRYHTMLNETLLRFFNGFHHDAHPMAMVSAVVASMSAFYHDTM